jgi:hypothetical protein
MPGTLGKELVCTAQIGILLMDHRWHTQKRGHQQRRKGRIAAKANHHCGALLQEPEECADGTG